MKKNKLRRLLAMLSTPDTDPETFNFVLERIIGIIHGVESDMIERDKKHESL